jgi:hypothetical protein
MSLGRALAGVAKGLLANPNFGTSITYQRVTVGAFNPATGAMATEGVATYRIRGTVEPFVRRFLAANRESADLVQLGDLQVNIAADALPFVPSTNDRVVIGGVQYGVVNVDPERAGDVAVIYGMHCRRGA